MNKLRLQLAIACGSLTLSAAWAQTAGTVLFAQDGARIVDGSGNSRPARKGDAVQAGERVVTPGNGISQVKLPDGSLIGLRPDSELRLEPPTGGSNPQRGLSLLQGNVRVVGAELAGKPASAPIALQAGNHSFQLRGADTETTLRKPDPPSAPPGQAPIPHAGAPGGGESGSLTRVNAGNAVLQAAGGNQALPVRQTSFVASGASAPVVVATLPGPGGPPPGQGSGPPPGQRPGSSGAGQPMPPGLQAQGGAGGLPAPTGGAPGLDRMASTLTAPGLRPPAPPPGIVPGGALPGQLPPLAVRPMPGIPPGVHGIPGAGPGGPGGIASNPSNPVINPVQPPRPNAPPNAPPKGPPPTGTQPPPPTGTLPPPPTSTPPRPSFLPGSGTVPISR